MKRLANFDVSRRYKRPSRRVAVQALFGIGCALSMIGIRSLLDYFAPTSGPFALVYPTVLIATLYGHVAGGSVAFTASFLWAWYFVLPAERSFSFEVASDPSRVLINAAAALVVLIFAEVFRRAVQSSVTERDQEIDRRQTLLIELEHRTKNNFALVSSLLSMQKRENAPPEVVAELDRAIGRIDSFASAYSNLAITHGEGTTVEVQPYLSELATRIADAALPENVSTNVRVQPMVLRREIAVALGLFVNEAVTNSAKYAFPDGQDGRVLVEFETIANGWRLSVSDDGVGALPTAPGDSSGLGSRLFRAFATQAEAKLEVEHNAGGRKLTLVSNAAADT